MEQVKQYTKKDLLKMKKHLYSLVSMESRLNKFIAFSNIASVCSVSGCAVSLCMYLERTLELEKALTAGGCSLAGLVMFGAASYFVNREVEALSDDILKYDEKCPFGMLDEVYDSVHRRR